MKKVLFAVILSLVIVSGASSAEKAIPAMQYDYNYMKFYMFKPNNLPKGFYVTYDGYIIYTAFGGLWKYASAETNGIVKTNYVVGAVVPSALNLKPYNRELSSVTPVLGSGRTDPEIPAPKSTRIVYTPPLPDASDVNASDWTQNANFMALGKWQKSVDTVGVISGQNIPVAWKGDFPAVIYAWTGREWRQLEPSSPHMSAMSIMRRGIYDLAVYTHKVNAPSWTNDDSAVLAQHTRMWGYKWQGMINLGRSY